jgi:hypothetical protein
MRGVTAEEVEAWKQKGSPCCRCCDVCFPKKPKRKSRR